MRQPQNIISDKSQNLLEVSISSMLYILVQQTMAISPYLYSSYLSTMPISMQLERRHYISHVSSVPTGP